MSLGKKQRNSFMKEIMKMLPLHLLISMTLLQVAVGAEMIEDFNMQKGASAISPARYYYF